MGAAFRCARGRPWSGAGSLRGVGVPVVSAAAPAVLLAGDRLARRVDLRLLIRTDRRICTRTTAGVRRAEPGGLVLEAQAGADGVDLRVWGPAGTDTDGVEAALAAARSWVGLDDDPAPLRDI